MTNPIATICKYFVVAFLPVFSCFAGEDSDDLNIMHALSEEEILTAQTATSRVWIKDKVQEMSLGDKKILYVLLEQGWDGGEKWILSPAEIEEKIETQHSTARDWFLKTSNGLFDIGESFDVTNILAHGNGQTWTKTAAIARDAGYDVASYDFLIAIESRNPSGAAVGVGTGGKVATVSLGHVPMLLHEIGHLLGLPHSNSYSRSIHPFDQAAKFEYGDSACVMGSMGRRGEFNPYYKEALGWIPTSSIEPVLTSGEYIIHAHDVRPIADKSLGLKVSGEAGENYILSFRNNHEIGNYHKGISIHSIPEQGFGASFLIDANTPQESNRSTDHALLAGDSLTHEAAGFTITVGDVINEGTAVLVNIQHSDFNPVADSDGDGVNDIDEQRLGRNPHDVSDFGFEFNEAGELYGFSLNERLADLQVNDDGLLTVTGGVYNTLFWSAKVRVGLDGSEFPALMVRFAVDNPEVETNTLSAATPRLVWTTTSGQTKTVFAQKSGHIDNVFSTAVFPLESVTGWTNESITSLEFWVDRTNNVATSIDWIRYVNPEADDDGDGIINRVEGFDDVDNDSILNFLDLDSDGDGLTDAQERETDEDGDAIPDFLDPATISTDNNSQDVDNTIEGDQNQNAEADGVANESVTDESAVSPVLDTDSDSDGDGINDAMEGDKDTDGDGIPDYLDLDSDSDGISDAETIDPEFIDTDSDGDGLIDTTEGDSDTDGDGIPNYLDLDSDADGISDTEEGIFDGDDDGIPAYTDADDAGEGTGTVTDAIITGPGCVLSGKKSAIDPVLLLLLLGSLAGLRRTSVVRQVRQGDFT